MKRTVLFLPLTYNIFEVPCVYSLGRRGGEPACMGVQVLHPCDGACGVKRLSLGFSD